MLFSVSSLISVVKKAVKRASAGSILNLDKSSSILSNYCFNFEAYVDVASLNISLPQAVTQKKIIPEHGSFFNFVRRNIFLDHLKK